MRYRELFEAVVPQKTVTKNISLKDGSSAHMSLTIEPTKASVVATVDGEFAGNATFYLNNAPDWDETGKGSWSASNLLVNPDFRRKGLATAMYALASASGLKIVRSGTYGGKLTPDGAAFWERQRDPKTMKYRQVWKAPKQR